MTLKELSDRIERIKEMNPRRWETLEVVVPIRGHGLGGRPFSKVKNVNNGIDWEAYRFNVETEHELTKINDSN